MHCGDADWMEYLHFELLADGRLDMDRSTETNLINVNVKEGGDEPSKLDIIDADEAV